MGKQADECLVHLGQAGYDNNLWIEQMGRHMDVV